MRKNEGCLWPVIVVLIGFVVFAYITNAIFESDLPEWFKYWWLLGR